MSVDRLPITRNMGAYRQDREPVVFAVLALNVAEFAASVSARVRRTERDRGCGSYLYVRPDGAAYIVSGDALCAERWVREHFDWLVGFYTRLPTPNRGLSLLVAGMVEDITEHMKSASGGRDEYAGLQRTGEANGPQPATGVAASRRLEAVAPADSDIPSPGGGHTSGFGA